MMHTLIDKNLNKLSDDISSYQLNMWSLFIIFLSLPMILGPISFIDRSIVNFASLMLSGGMYLLINYKFKFNIKIFLYFSY